MGVGERNPGWAWGFRKEYSRRNDFTVRVTGIEHLGEIVNLFRLERVAADVDVARKVLDRKHHHEDAPEIRRKRPATDMITHGQHDAFRILSYCKWLQVSDTEG